jgi:hypothetical protein
MIRTRLRCTTWQLLAAMRPRLHRGSRLSQRAWRCCGIARKIHAAAPLLMLSKITRYSCSFIGSRRKTTSAYPRNSTYDCYI